METEKRIEKKRSKVSRELVLNCLDSGMQYKGFTSDVSDGGLRASLNGAPPPGSNVMVKLIWDEKQKPVESFGTVAWTNELPPGKGIHVGLMLGMDPPKQKPRKRPDSLAKSRHNEELSFKKTIAVKSLFANNPVANKIVANKIVDRKIFLKEGKKVTLHMGLTEEESRIFEIGDIQDDGTINVTFKLLDKKYLNTKIVKNPFPVKNEEPDLSAFATDLPDYMSENTTDGMDDYTNDPMVEISNPKMDQSFESVEDEDIDVSEWKKTPVDDARDFYIKYFHPYLLIFLNKSYILFNRVKPIIKKIPLKVSPQLKIRLYAITDYAVNKGQSLLQPLFTAVKRYKKQL
ncbi:MAG: PilZ domain-containing protein [Deltaproteobacteria bacterium]|nr:PilZ domain-containing protein [Deltaproteobacteria bacterium]